MRTGEVLSNPGVKRSAKQRGRCSVPVVLRTPAPAYAERWASLGRKGMKGPESEIPLRLLEVERREPSPYAKVEVAIARERIYIRWGIHEFAYPRLKRAARIERASEDKTTH